ncbi:MAG: C-terminal binding protein [Anaerolineae bacterium]|nr:C-terminal binding protein [Anaerolineae bacterium]
MATVVLAHEDAIYTKPEQEILRGIGAELIHERKLDSLIQNGQATRVDALMVGTERVTAGLLAGLPNLRIISHVGTGLEAIDLDAAAARGVWVTNVPDFSVDEVSGHALALLLAHARRLRMLFDQSRRGVWDPMSFRPYDRLQGQTVGVLGFGRIGQRFVHKARGLGLKVIAHDTLVEPFVIDAAGARPVTWQKLLQTSDYISLHVPLNDSTYHIVNADTLAQMKPNAYLINTARGGLVDTDALLAAVRAGKIAGAALDVFEPEPLPADHSLWYAENISVTPHLAWYSEDSMREVKVRATQEVVRVLRGETPWCPMNQPGVGA